MTSTGDRFTLTTAPKRPNSQPRPWEQQGDEDPVSFGVWLRQQREARDIGLQEIAASSKVGIRVLEAFEQDRFDRLPAPVFARGFLREYAKYVGLNPDDVVNFFISAQKKAVEPEGAVVAPAGQTAGTRPKRELAYVLSVAAFLTLLLAVAALLAWFVQKRQHTGAAAATAPATTAAVNVRPGPVPPLPLPPASSKPLAPLRAQLDFTQDCWVEREIDGGPRISELRVVGESLVLEAQKSVLLSLGNPAGAALSVNGKPYPIPQTSKVLRDLLLEAPPATRSSAEPAPAQGSAASQ